jgi:hypothetical protein
MPTTYALMLCPARAKDGLLVTYLKLGVDKKPLRVSESE